MTMRIETESKSMMAKNSNRMSEMQMTGERMMILDEILDEMVGLKAIGERLDRKIAFLESNSWSCL